MKPRISYFPSKLFGGSASEDLGYLNYTRREVCITKCGSLAASSPWEVAPEAACEGE